MNDHAPIYPRVHKCTPRGGNKFKLSVHLLACKTYLMGDPDATTSEEEFDDLPALVDPDHDFLSETSEEEYVPPARRVCRKRKNNKRATRGRNKRNKNHKTKSNKKKGRKVKAVNTTYASKQKCADRDAVKDFLANADCGCKQQCIKCLRKLEDDGAVEMILDLRQRRFASKCTHTNNLHSTRSFAVNAAHASSIVKSRHPRGKRCS